MVLRIEDWKGDAFSYTYVSSEDQKLRDGVREQHVVDSGQWWWGDMERMGSRRGGGWIRREEIHSLTRPVVA